MEIEKVQLQTLEGKNKSIILRKQYDLLCGFILDALHQYGSINLMKLIDLANHKFKQTFSGEIIWLLLNVKRDLEARGTIKVKYEKKRKQMISLKKEQKKAISISGNPISAKHNNQVFGTHSTKLKNWIANY
jgi:hypothetical protein